jgi:hypothetical protein
MTSAHRNIAVKKIQIKKHHADIQAANIILARATRPALTSGPEATPAHAGVLAQARRPNDAQAA